MQTFCSVARSVKKLPVTLSEEKHLLLLNYSNVYNEVRALEYDEKKIESIFDAVPVLKTGNSSKYYH